MVELVARGPADGLVPHSVGDNVLSAPDPGRLTWIAAGAGQEKALAAALRKTIGLGWPAPGRMISKGDARIAWFGERQALLIGPAAPRLDGAAVSEQSDGWTLLRLEGSGAREILMRVSPLDLRAGKFGAGRAARSLVIHVPVMLLGMPGGSFDMLVPRSMTGTVLADVIRAMEIHSALDAVER